MFFSCQKGIKCQENRVIDPLTLGLFISLTLILVCSMTCFIRCVINQLLPKRGQNTQRASQRMHQQHKASRTRPVHCFTQNVFRSFREIDGQMRCNVPRAACINKNQFRLSPPRLASAPVHFVSFWEVSGKAK